LSGGADDGGGKDVDIRRSDDDVPTRLKLVTDVKPRFSISIITVKDWLETILVALALLITIFYGWKMVEWFMTF
jgi:hypothetical protein